MAFLTRPERRQRVHTRMRKAEPLTSAFTRCKLGLKTRFVLLFAWLTLLPVWCFFPQRSQANATDLLLCCGVFQRLVLNGAECYHSPTG